LIVHAEDRDAAIQRMQIALRDFIVHGVVTNIDFMQAVLAHVDFAQGKVSTSWVEENFKEWNVRQPSTEAFIAAALADVVFVGARSQPAVSNETDPFSPWRQTNNYRN